MPTENRTFTAQWDINQYTITFMDDDGTTVLKTITQDYNTAVTAPANPTKTGYTFVAWDKAIPATMPAEDVSITATWKINSHNVTWIVDGETIAEQDYNFGEVIERPTDPQKADASFGG